MSHSFIQLPPDSTGKKLHSHTVSAEDGISHNQIFTLGDPNNHSQLQYVDAEGQAYVRFAEGAPLFDAFGKLKISEEVHIINLLSYYDGFSKKGYLEKFGTLSNVVHNQNKSSNVFTTDLSSGNYTKWTTNKRFFYNVGMGNYVLSTLNIGDSGKEGVVRRWGFYDDNDGLFFELDGTSLKVVIRSSTSGTPVDTAVSQENWNNDRLDGTGISNFNIDITKVNIYWLDFQWLGAGRVRFGVVDEEGKRLTCHEFRNANQNNDMYMGNPTLPYRVEQFNKTDVVSVSQLSFYNMGVITDGNIEIPFIQIAGALDSLIQIQPGIVTPIWSIKLKDTFEGRPNFNVILPSSLDIFTESCPVLFTIVKNATLTGATWSYDLGSNSAAVGDITTSEVSGGTIVFATIVAPGQAKNIDLSNMFKFNMSTEYIKINANGLSDTYTLVAKSLGVSACNIYPLMTWKESLI